MKNRKCGNKSHNSTAGIVILAVISGIFVMAVCAMSVWIFVFRTVPKFSKFTLELGDEIPEEASFYMTGAEFRFGNAGADITEVNNLKEGSYPVKIDLSGTEYVLEVEIVDTTAPKLVMRPGETVCVKVQEGDNYQADSDNNIQAFDLELGQAYTADYFFSEIYELSGFVSIDLYVNDNYTMRVLYENGLTDDAFCFDNQGYYNVTFAASDSAGNTAYYDADLLVEDTTAPEISIQNNIPYYETGKIYSVEDFADIYDASGTEVSYLVVDGNKTDTVSFDAKGDYRLSIVSSDEAGNESAADLKVSFDDAPVFIAFHDQSIHKGTDFDPLQYIAAVDSMDGNLTDSISVDMGDFDPNKNGTYTVTYYVTDSCGLTSSVSENITVGVTEDTSYELTKAEWQYLEDYGYFSYEPLEDADFRTSYFMVAPTLANLKYIYPDGSYIAGSGFIYEIDEDYIYIVTDEHVIKDMTGIVEIMLSDSSAYVASEPVSDKVIMSSETECAMFRIPTADIPYNVLLELKQVYVDYDIYNELEFNQELFAYSGHFLNEEGRYCKLLYKNTDTYFGDTAQHCVETTHGVIQGMSGCPLFDEYGRLVGVTEGYTGVYNYMIGDYEYSDNFLMINGLEDMYAELKN